MSERKIELDALIEDLEITLRPGMAWVLYMDNGPGGPCGQGGRTTCPHTTLYLFTNESDMRTAVANGIGRNKKAGLHLGVIGDWSSPSLMSVVFDEEPTQ